MGETEDTTPDASADEQPVDAQDDTTDDATASETEDTVPDASADEQAADTLDDMADEAHVAETEDASPDTFANKQPADAQDDTGDEVPADGVNSDLGTQADSIESTGGHVHNKGMTDSNESAIDTGLDDKKTNAFNALSDYMNEHNYGPGDFETYSQDPAWRELQNAAFPEYELPPLSQEKAFNALSNYMNEHNYGSGDFETYSQDPTWRELQNAAFPEYELPPLSQEKAFNALSNYMNEHNYGSGDFETYSQDPTWRELQSAAFPNYELPPLKTNEYSSIIDTLNDANVVHRPIELADGQRITSDIVEQLGGGDLTEGSCSSLAFAYAGNKAGYSVLDFRDGASREFFSSNDAIRDIANLPGISSKTLLGTDDIQCANELLSGMENGKEYYLATGLHASIVRNGDNGYEFLELQTANNNGWKPLNDTILHNRFGCESNNTLEYPNFLIDVDSLGNSAEFRNILGYINTAELNQVKGASGHVR